MEKLNINPESLFSYFMQICEIPHGSKNEARISSFLYDFGKELGYETLTDSVGNVLSWNPYIHFNRGEMNTDAQGGCVIDFTDYE